MAIELAALGHPGRVDGIDVSQVQGLIDWQRVAGAGFRFAVVKASEGRSYCDPRAAANLAGARAAGLVAMVYGFARPSQGEPADQARQLWECSGDVMPARAALDLEGAPDDWTADRIIAFAESFAAAWRTYSALEAIVYTYPYFAGQRCAPALARSARLKTCPLWIASYHSTSAPWAPSAVQTPPVPAPWSTWAMWQYSGDGGYRVPGVPGDCDRDLFLGSETELRAFCGWPDADTAPEIAVVHPSVPLPRHDE